ncbi:sodium/potassium-transporting ATPase subunit beta-2-like [Copidosoma floridanum]|uniref:sodium/potassium-transporting ATPase subunit beta-2-like n=1 Tax=Copidosoma floridanum TaxID=29053 RepID=UPI0006C9D252|nr:sodium/potassium-transporting ATPase subunit beta-2-like [Copidosoma floridanum]
MNSLPVIRHDDNYFRARKPKPDLGVLQNFKLFVWDPERKAIFDRTAREWVEVGLFYLCFYGVLFSFAGLQLWLTYKYVTIHDKPYFQYNKRESKSGSEPSRVFRMTSLNMRGPGIVFKPNIGLDSNPPLILIDKSNELGQPRNYIKAINETLSEYKVDKSRYDPRCNDRVLREGGADKSCFFDLATLGQCSRAPYGYEESKPQPCVYIKFNKRFDWVPIFYSQASALPENMPVRLQRVVKSTDKFHVWLSCEGKSKEDTKLMGELEYLPISGFPVQFFPYSGQSDYLSPVVALRFKNLTEDHLVKIECKTWAHNIDNENRYNLNFRVMIKNRGR